MAPSPVPKPREPSNDREEPDPTLCTDSSVDAMLTLDMSGKKRTYAFKGENYWRLTSTGVERGYPKRIREMWGGLPGNLDAILPNEESNRIYFFKVCYTGMGLDSVRWCKYRVTRVCCSLAFLLSVATSQNLQN